MTQVPLPHKSALAITVISPRYIGDCSSNTGHVPVVQPLWNARPVTPIETFYSIIMGLFVAVGACRSRIRIQRVEDIAHGAAAAAGGLALFPSSGYPPIRARICFISRLCYMARSCLADRVGLGLNLLR
jgi:hypothetical protein